MKKPTHEVFCRTQFIGFHMWIHANGEAKYLSYPHRHVFHVEACVRVSHTDRNIEFIHMKSQIDRELQATFVSTQEIPLQLSCEQMAEHIGRFLCSQSYKPLYVEVSEDGENGGRVRYE